MTEGERLTSWWTRMADPARIRVVAENLVLIDMDVPTLVVHLLLQQGRNLRLPATIYTITKHGTHVDPLEELQESECDR